MALLSVFASSSPLCVFPTLQSLLLPPPPFISHIRSQLITGFNVRGLDRSGGASDGSVQPCKAHSVFYEGDISVRRSANYQPPNWDYDSLQSLTSGILERTDTVRVNELKEQVGVMLEEEGKHMDQLELIDVLKRLGVSYHFEPKIKAILRRMHQNSRYHHSHIQHPRDLYATALELRLLREHGFHVPQEVFNNFKDEMGNFKAWVCEDVKGMLALYEASFLLVEGETILEEAREFTAKQLKESLLLHEKKMKSSSSSNSSSSSSIDRSSAVLVSHALELPLHWRMLRLEARWFIDFYQNTQDSIPILLELAKLDFNMVQATHQQELRHVSRWWESTGLGQKLSFARDRIMENFFWTVGVIYEPQFGDCRIMLAKVNALITTIDDVYDVYGTIDELKLFTDAVDRWDINAMEGLPGYMKLCFLGLYNSINEMGYDVLKEQDTLVIPYLQKAWAKLCKAYLVEAEWYSTGYTPTLQEYIDNAWISIAAPVILVHSYFSVTNPITEEALRFLVSNPNIVQCSSMILRLANDLGTSSDELKRGDVPKSIQCYMHETGASEEETREHLRCLVGDTWKKMNQTYLDETPFSHTFVGVAKNLARMAQCMYQHGDGHGHNEDNVSKSHMMSLLLMPFS